MKNKNTVQYSITDKLAACVYGSIFICIAAVVIFKLAAIIV